MIWFFAFTSVGMSILLTILVIKHAIRLGWRHWLGGLAAMGLLGWLSLGLPVPRRAGAVMVRTGA